MPLSALAAAAGAAASVWLLLPARSTASADPGGLPPGRPLASAPRLFPLGLAAASATGLSVLLDGTDLALALICLAAAAAGWQLGLRSRARRRAEARAERVVETCEALAGELRAGQPPLTALRHAVDVWPELELVMAAGRLGADVPQAFRHLAGLPGAWGLHDVASAWQVSEASGSTMALALGNVAESARRRRVTEHLIASELASARATARLVALLPLAVLTLGSGLGADPWGFLTDTPVGLTCLGCGLALAFAGTVWLESIAGSAVRP